jgi:hypothetical protein
MPEYQDVRDEMKTGDLLLWSGKGDVSNIIKFGTGSEFSHVGKVVRSDERDAVLLWESTTLSNVRDIETGRYTKGVQLVSLSDRLARYDGDVYWQPLNKPLENWRIEASWEFRKKVAGRPYQKWKLALALSLLKGYPGQEDLSSLFCSELVAEDYQAMQLLYDVEDGGRPSDKYTPEDLSIHGNIQLRDGFSFPHLTKLD